MDLSDPWNLSKLHTVVIDSRRGCGPGRKGEILFYHFPFMVTVPVDERLSVQILAVSFADKRLQTTIYAETLGILDRKMRTCSNLLP